MSAVSDRMTADVKRPGGREVVVGFSAQAVRAPFLLRCGSVIIDYVIFIAIPVMALLTSRFAGNDGAKLLNDGLNSTGWLLALLVAVVNIILLPMFAGQSLGKIATGLRIVANDGGAASMRAIAFRQTGGYLLTLFTLGLGFLFSLFSSKGRALHDYLAGTVVIYARRTVRN